jgi:hypothetical protein
MIEMIFNTADGPMVIQIAAPAKGEKWPWVVEVRTNGRPQYIPGDDPIEALAMAARFTAGYLSGREGLDPPVRPPDDPKQD